MIQRSEALCAIFIFSFQTMIPGELISKRLRKQQGTYFVIISGERNRIWNQAICKSVPTVICRGHFGAQLEYVPASDTSERLFWCRSRRHMVPLLIPLTTYAPLPPALVTAQQTFPVFVQILEEKKGWLPAATTNHVSTPPAEPCSQFHFLLCPSNQTRVAKADFLKAV